MVGRGEAAIRGADEVACLAHAPEHLAPSLLVVVGGRNDLGEPSRGGTGV